MLRNALAIIAMLGAEAVAFGASYRVVPTFPDGARPGERTVLQFQLFRGRSDVPLTAADLQIEHEKKIHLFALDSGFQVYRHVHPDEVGPGIFQIPIILTTAGEYRFWLQILPVGEVTTKTLSFNQDFLHFPGEEVPEGPVSTEPRLKWASGAYEVTLSFPEGEPVQHASTALRFIVTKDGLEVPPSELDPYLGAKMHIVGVSADKADFVHIHPHQEGDVTSHFMQAGYFGLFMQFSHQGVLQTTQFAIAVAPPQ